MNSECSTGEAGFRRQIIKRTFFDAPIHFSLHGCARSAKFRASFILECDLGRIPHTWDALSRNVPLRKSQCKWKMKNEKTCSICEIASTRQGSQSNGLEAPRGTTSSIAVFHLWKEKKKLRNLLGYGAVEATEFARLEARTRPRYERFSTFGTGLCTGTSHANRAFRHERSELLLAKDSGMLEAPVRPENRKVLQ